MGSLYEPGTKLFANLRVFNIDAIPTRLSYKAGRMAFRCFSWGTELNSLTDLVKLSQKKKKKRRRSCRIVWQDRWDHSGPQAVVCGCLVYLPQWEVGHRDDRLRTCLTQDNNTAYLSLSSPLVLQGTAQDPALPCPALTEHMYLAGLRPKQIPEHAEGQRQGG